MQVRSTCQGHSPPPISMSGLVLFQCLWGSATPTRSLYPINRGRQRSSSGRNQSRRSDSSLQWHGYDLCGFRWGNLLELPFVSCHAARHEGCQLVLFSFSLVCHAFVLFISPVFDSNHVSKQFLIRYVGFLFLLLFFCLIVGTSLTSFDANGLQKIGIEILNVLHFPSISP